MTRLLRLLAAGAALSLLTAGAAGAQEVSADAAPSAASAASDAPAPADRRPFAAAKVADDDTLDLATAREDISLVASGESSSSVSSSSVNGTSVTGDISFSDTAMQNASGMTVINSNTGNNVAMNATLNVNVVITPPPSQ